MSPRARRSPGVFLSCILLVALAAGCGVSSKGPTAPPPGTRQVRGTVSRGAVAAAAVKVKLYDDASGTQVDSVLTGSDGAYGFDGVPPGSWMVKVSGPTATDLGYVRWFFATASAGQGVVVPPFDIAAHGFDLISPTDGANVPRPGFTSPLTFSWSAYGAPYLWAAVHIDDPAGTLAWASAQAPVTQVSWNGIGNEGPYAGQALAAGAWSWRVKLRFANSVQGASRERVLNLQ